jgi:hypothetical protein
MAVSGRVALGRSAELEGGVLLTERPRSARKIAVIGVDAGL